MYACTFLFNSCNECLLISNPFTDVNASRPKLGLLFTDAHYFQT